MTAFKIKVADSDLRYDCPDDQTLMRAMGWSNKRGVPIGCRKGACGACRIQILAGTFETSSQPSRFLTDEDRSSGFVLGCRTLPSGDLVIRIPAETLALIRKSASVGD